LAEARNNLDSLIYTTEKSLSEFGDKIDASEKKAIEDAVERAKKALESDDVSTIKSASDNLTQTSHKLAEAMYAKASQQPGGAQAEASQGQESEARTRGSEEDVVDADFEEVKDDQK
jgi:molecular chaperone DnaK